MRLPFLREERAGERGRYPGPSGEEQRPPPQGPEDLSREGDVLPVDHVMQDLEDRVGGEAATSSGRARR